MFGLPPILLLSATLFVGLLSLALVSDAHTFRIPNRISVALVALYPVYVSAAIQPADWAGSIGLMIVTLAVGLAAFAMRVLGGGDVKLLAVGALWAGPEAAAEFFILTGLIGGAFALIFVTPYRINLALLCQAAGQTHMRDVFLGNVIPYGLAISSAGILVITPRILNIPLY